VTSRGVPGPAALAVALGAAAFLLLRAADGARAEEARAAGGAPPLGIVNVLAVDLLWLRADALYAGNRWPEMDAAYEAAGRVEPRLATSWEFRGFHLAYDLAGSAASPADRDRWVLEGVRVLSEGLARNPRSTDLRAWLGHALFERSARWPSLAPALRDRRGRDPLDEAVDLLGAAAAAEPGFGRAVVWFADALGARGRRALAEAGEGRPSPAAAADFARAAAALRAFAATAPEEGRRVAEDLALGFDALRERAEGR
jgi:hypothetical protein